MENNRLGAQAHFSTAIIFKLIYPKKQTCTFFKNKHIFRGKHARWHLPKVLLQVQPSLIMSHPRRVSLSHQRIPSWDAVTELARPTQCM